MTQRVDEWETEKKEFEHQKKEFFEKRDNSEELHDLQQQEMAKLKHMVCDIGSCKKAEVVLLVG